jgi:uroporphyrinogen III methyltransferase/synthase
MGADVAELPVIALEEAADPGPLNRAIAQLEKYDWIVFTSVNGVGFFVNRLDASARDLRAFRARVCAIGPATRKALEALHLKVDLIPEEYVAESVIAAFASVDLNEKRVLLPRAAVARDLIPVGLAKRGALVDVVEAYRNVVPADAVERAAQIFGSARRPNWITFTSSSTVTNFLVVAGAAALDGVKIASIGPVTSETIRRHGLHVHREASVYTMEGLIACLKASA